MVEMAKTKGVALRITNGPPTEEEAGGDDDEEDVKLGFLTEVSCTRLALCCPGRLGWYPFWRRLRSGRAEGLSAAHVARLSEKCEGQIGTHDLQMLKR